MHINNRCDKMKEFYIKVPDEQESFFVQLIEQLGYEYEQFFDSDVPDFETDEEQYFTDADD